ncbi:MAG: ATP-dependent DNA helicase RecG [Rhodospirillales bacterium]|nr:ATP-dependent DNA helicase RecG [Rhodospirillales bacterium]
MRPEVLYPLFAEARALPGVGPRVAKLIERLAGQRVVDLLWHLPAGIVDRRYRPAVAAARAGAVATVTVLVRAHQPPSSSRYPYKVLCSDPSGVLTLVFFHPRADYLSRALPVGAECVVSGRIERFGADVQMAHPDYIVPLDQRHTLPEIEPVYPLTAGLTPRGLGKIIRAALDRAPDLPEWQDPAFVTRNAWQPWRSALMAVHAPDGEAALLPLAPARSRLAYDELLANQLALALVRRRQRHAAGRAIRADGVSAARALNAVGFALTESQRRAVAEITADMAAETRMLRLLQGDVGSGKTVVALLAMLTAVESGVQAALMAPTEILARQHLATIGPLAAAAGVRAALLTGREKGKNRSAILDALGTGDIGIVVGTHALFQSDVAFADLALVVFDEQHRFGVHQRLDLASKGRAVDILVMTATPIPRTLMMTAYGDMDVSKLLEKPPGRRPVDTRVVPADRLDDVVAAVGRSLDAGARAYWICPLVEESDVVDVSAAEERFRELRARFGARVGLVHGRLKGPDKDRAMADFAGGEVDLLVATTVVEVGVDVPAATVMVIEHAERFGLAQLHQLRGRIGRGEAASTCLLVYAPPLGEAARARLAIMRETEDGFRIAEEDLRLRGAGELLGTRQSGMPSFRLADLDSHAELLVAARDDARLILNRDPELASERGRALRTLLYLFERDVAVRYLRSG